MVSVSGGILDNVLRAVLEAKDAAVNKKQIQTIDVYSRGHRVDISWGKIIVIPPSVCDTFANIPPALRDGCAFHEFHGDDWANFESFRLAESEFDAPDPKLVAEFKEKVFRSTESNRLVPVILFQPTWGYSRDAMIIRWIKDEVKLREAIRHLVFGAYFNQALSSMFTSLVTTDDRLSVDNITDKQFDNAFGWHPESEDPLKVGTPGLEKKATQKRMRVCASEDMLRRVMAVLDNADPDKSKEEEEEDAFFDAVEETLMNLDPDKQEEGVKTAKAKVADGLSFCPGQVLQEFYPDMQNEMLKYPVQNNSGMPEPMSEVSDCPASGSLNPKPSILQESVPLRTEMQLRGPGFMNDFYRSVVTLDPSKLQLAASKRAAAGEVEFNAKEEITTILQGVCGEIVATLLAAYKVTSRPLAVGVPGDGSVSLSPNGVSNVPVSPQMDMFLHDRIAKLCEKLNDGDLQEIVNSSWSQGAIWCDSEKGGFTYEVLVRAESFDDESLELKYKYLVNIK
jgi:hypothetical protein